VGIGSDERQREMGIYIYIYICSMEGNGIERNDSVSVARGHESGYIHICSMGWNGIGSN
jgi:hypothetical protein